MKINKLFHWLYAFLMALPIFAVLSACLISTFNMSAKEESEIIYKYETNEVNSRDDLIVGRVYHFNITSGSLDEFAIRTSDETLFTLRFYFINSIDFSNYSVYVDEMILTDSEPSITFLDFRIDNSMNGYYLSPMFDFCTYVGINEPLDNESFTLEGDFILTEKNDIFTNFSCFSRCENVPIDNVVTYNLDTQDIFYNAIDNVKQSPLFNWAYNSNILGVPISYIGGIFGLASNTIINVLLCYWVAISIIWLVFDVLMFVPLLVHKTIDKMRF